MRWTAIPNRLVSVNRLAELSSGQMNAIVSAQAARRSGAVLLSLKQKEERPVD